MANDLTPQQQLFLEHPDALLEPQKAAREVGFSDSFATTKAYALRKSLLPRLFEKHRARQEALGITDERIENELAGIAFANIIEFYETITGKDGRSVSVLTDLNKLPPALQRAVQSVKYETTFDANGLPIVYISEIKLYDKLKALTTLAEMRGAFNEKQPFGTSRKLAQVEDDNPLAGLTADELQELLQSQERAAKILRKRVDRQKDVEAIEHKPAPVRRKRVTDDPEDF